MVKKIDPWASEMINDYDKLIKDFGMEPFKAVLKKIPEPHC